jgi:hypothetical protein
MIDLTVRNPGSCNSQLYLGTYGINSEKKGKDGERKYHLSRNRQYPNEQ